MDMHPPAAEQKNYNDGNYRLTLAEVDIILKFDSGKFGKIFLMIYPAFPHRQTTEVKFDTEEMPWQEDGGEVGYCWACST